MEVSKNRDCVRGPKAHDCLSLKGFKKPWEWWDWVKHVLQLSQNPLRPLRIAGTVEPPEHALEALDEAAEAGAHFCEEPGRLQAARSLLQMLGFSPHVVTLLERGQLMETQRKRGFMVWDRFRQETSKQNDGNSGQNKHEQSFCGRSIRTACKSFAKILRFCKTCACLLKQGMRCWGLHSKVN